MKAGKMVFQKLLAIMLVMGLFFAALPAAPALAASGDSATPTIADWSEPVNLTHLASGRPAVVLVGTTYHMWYTMGAQEDLYYTSSKDPASFPTGRKTTGLVLGEQASPAVIYDSGFKMINYADADCKSFALYTSANGINWTKGAVVYDATSISEWLKIDAPFLLKDGTGYKLYFQAKTTAEKNPYHIYVAQGTLTAGGFSGATEALAPSESGWDSYRLLHPWVVKVADGDYIMWFGGYDTSFVEHVGVATSADGITWAKAEGNPIINNAAEPAVVFGADGKWHMWYGTTIKHSVSDDPDFAGKTFDAVLMTANGRPTIVLDAGTYHMWYSAGGVLYYTTSPDGNDYIAAKQTTGLSVLQDSQTVWKEGTTFYMIGYGDNEQTFDLFKSTNGINWSVNTKNVYSGAGLPADWAKIDCPMVLQDGTGYKLYFQMKNNATDPVYAIYMAEGVTKNSFGDAVLALAPSSGGFDSFRVLQPYVVKLGEDSYLMYYSGYSKTNSTLQISFATSADGRTFTQGSVTPILGGYGAESNVLNIGGIWHMWYSATGAIKHFMSSDLIEFSSLQAALSGSVPGSTINLLAGTYNYPGGFLLDQPGLTVRMAPGAVIQNDSPCFIVTADNITLEGGICVPTGGSNGIDVADGVDYLIVQGMEIDGATSGGTANGIAFTGDHKNVQILDNYFHDLGGVAIDFGTGAYTEYFEVQGNYLKGEIMARDGSTLDVTYNNWDLPAGPGTLANLTTVPFTYAGVSVAPTTDKMLVGDELTYSIQLDPRKVTGTELDLVYDPAVVSVKSVTCNDGDFDLRCVVDTSTPGVIHFSGVSYTAKDSLTNLYTVVFTGAADGTSALDADETDALFAMFSGGSSTKVYANVFSDGVVTVYAHGTVTGAVQLQGRPAVKWTDAVVELTDGVNGYAPYTFAPSAAWGAVSQSRVVFDTYTLGITRTNYLPVVGKSLTVDGVNVSLAAVKLLGGDVVADAGNAINPADAALVGTQYGTADTADINGDGMVDLYDLTILGGNYGATSATAY